MILLPHTYRFSHLLTFAALRFNLRIGQQQQQQQTCLQYTGTNISLLSFRGSWSLSRTLGQE